MGLFTREDAHASAYTQLVQAKDETIAELRARIRDLEAQLATRASMAPIADRQQGATFGPKTRAVLASVPPGNPLLKQQLATAAAVLMADEKDDAAIATLLRRGDRLSTSEDI